MAWKQVRNWNESKGGRVVNSCLANTRKGFDIAPHYGTAWQAWNGTQKHTARDYPAGVYTPIYFSYTTTIGGKKENYGHIGTRYPDGTFWTDGRKFSSVEEYERQKAPKFVGWGESINGVRVIQWIDEPKPAPAATGKRLYFTPIGQTATFYPVRGGTFAMKIKDASYNWNIIENQGNRVKVYSASAGGDCWVYLTYTATGKPIPGRYIK